MINLLNDEACCRAYMGWESRSGLSLASLPVACSLGPVRSREAEATGVGRMQ